MSDLPPLKPKHALFLAEYKIDRNQAQAAIRAGFSERRAKQAGAELRAREDIAAHIAAWEAEVIADAEERGRDARAELEEIAFMPVGASLKDAAPALLNVKRAALVDVLRLDGKFIERRELSGPGGKPIQIQGVHDLSDDELAAIAGAGRGRTPATEEGATKPDRVLERGGNSGKTG